MNPIAFDADTRLSPKAQRVAAAAGASLFLSAFHFAYTSWVSPVFGYLGFTYPQHLGFTTWFGYLCGISTSIFLPLSLRRPSQFLQWMIYLMVYLPSVLAVSFMELSSNSDIWHLQGTLTLGMIILCLPNFARVRPLPEVSMSPQAFSILTGLVGAIMLLRVVIIYWGRFDFVSWDQTYESVRFAGSDIADAAGLAYPIGWLAFVFLPVFATLALYRREAWLFGLVIGCDILLYGTQGMKHILFSPAYIVALFLVLRRRSGVFGLRLLLGSAAFLGGFGGYVRAFDAVSTRAAIFLGTNIVTRVFATPGLMLAVYQKFMASHPYTYYSHVTGINWFVHYPYRTALGLEVGLVTSGQGDYDMNAGFWATDGLAAMGLPGIILISAFAALVFYFIDGLNRKLSSPIISLCLSQYVIALINMSFFTSFVTGGLVLLIPILYCMPASLFRAGAARFEHRPGAALPRMRG